MFDVRFLRKGPPFSLFVKSSHIGGGTERIEGFRTVRETRRSRATEMNPLNPVPDANNSPRESIGSNNLSNPPNSQIASHGNNIGAMSFVGGHSHNSGTSVQGMLSNLAAGSGFTVEGPASTDHSVQPSASLNSLSAVSRAAANVNVHSAAASVNAVVRGVSETQSIDTVELAEALNEAEVKTDNELSAMSFSVYSLAAAFFAGLITAALIYVLLGNGNLGSDV